METLQQLSEKPKLHPFEIFLPENATVLILGSFPGKEHTRGNIDTDAWYYGARRNQFWKIISEVYGEELNSKQAKQNLFKKHGIAIGDIFLKVNRKDNGNLDTNLIVIENNKESLLHIFKKCPFKKIYFTSKFVEKEFRKLFPEMENCEYLPSPSPRYAAMTKQEKIKYYKTKLPA